MRRKVAKMKKKIEHIRELRRKTGAPIVDCKKVLLECSGDPDKAESVLIKKGFNLAKNKEELTTEQGVITSYVHHDESIGVLVEVNCETDFVARNTEFKEFTKDIAMQIAACPPPYLSREDVPEDILNNIPEEKREEYYKLNCLMAQPFIKDPERTIKELITSAIAKLGENIRVKRFVRYEVGK
ncbi:elongation factor Ts [Candidatus Desantisbacteria bacterium CG07_land_8_20_14_0_80_39_15]|uniref:Elongation factor Ts n=3 Tax=unclassified Candidatus Desantisiibacteriota TaxID=3106372 RepID=A0A2H9PB25_9BACT|nr:MAG: elongation factor Ts [Candidatus Desantisbacteria bacterium CG07_land_8_20_14_0_80_39_15]PIZ15834.1 MAG: elongation factor Ts [Candidatus Desantisbacteria bacterium CG_4_10_14_0_8_um_filter_39_17]